MKKGYKVVRRSNDGRLVSFVAGRGRFPEGREIEYKIGEFVTHVEGDGPLAVFHTIIKDTHKLAVEFIYNCGYEPDFTVGYIYEVKYTRASEKALWVIESSGYVQRIGKIFTPDGTDFAETVKLVRLAYTVTIVKDGRPIIEVNKDGSPVHKERE